LEAAKGLSSLRQANEDGCRFGSWLKSLSISQGIDFCDIFLIFSTTLLIIAGFMIQS